MFEQAPEWISRSPRIRKMVIKIWRIFLPLQRATLAKAVLIARRQDDCVRATTSFAGFGLTSLELNGWKTVEAQVQEWANQTWRQPGSPQLLAIDGTLAERGSRFSILSASMGHRRNKVLLGSRLSSRLQRLPSEIVTSCFWRRAASAASSLQELPL
jgi:hypothetical protein